jgi:hypothetical protein
MEAMKWKWIQARLLIGLIASIALGASSATASYVEDVAQVQLEAAGGHAAHTALRSLRARGVTRISGQELPFILNAARPRNVRIETIGATGTLVSAFDGVHAPWQKRDLVGAPTRFARGTEDDFVAEAEFDSLFYDRKARGIELEEAGDAEVNGRPCMRLLATVRLTEAYTLYLDKETMMMVRRDQRKIQAGRTVVVETYYSDFRPVAGVMLPFRIRVQVGHKIASDTEITEMIANSETPPDFFNPPVAGWPRW